MFLFDTDHLGILQDQVEPEVSRLLGRMSQRPLTDFYVSTVSFHEQVAGWYNYLNRARTAAATVLAYQMFENILADFAAMQVLPFDEDAAAMFESLRKQRVRIGTLDLRIASIALVRDCTLLSRNLVHLRKVPGLKLEDWTAV